MRASRGCGGTREASARISDVAVARRAVAAVAAATVSAAVALPVEVEVGGFSRTPEAVAGRGGGIGCARIVAATGMPRYSAAHVSPNAP